MKTRRAFLRTTGAFAALSGLGDFGFLRGLPRVTAAEARLVPHAVQFDGAMEPLVRWLEETPRERLLEEAGARVVRGLSYRELLGALLLAGVRNVQPRPVGFKFHAVLVVHSAHLASLASPDEDRWLPIFWALDYFKSSQAEDERQGDWTMGPVEASRVPPGHRARQAFLEAMDQWDEPAADAAAVGLARSMGADALFEIFCHYGARDFRDIGHKAIYVANAFRTLEVIGWQHAEPVLRSLAYALLDRGGDNASPARSDFAADRPFRHNAGEAGRIRGGWLDGRTDEGAVGDLLECARAGSAADASGLVVRQLNDGVGPESVFDALFCAAGELLMRAPGIRSLHAVTFANAVRYAWGRCADEPTRKLLLLQAASFLPLFRGGGRVDGVRIDRLEASPVAAAADLGLEDIFATVGTDRLEASRKVLGWLRDRDDPSGFGRAARRLIFLKGRNSHDYKFSSAVLEDYAAMRSPWRERFLASSVFNLRGSTEADNELVARTRAALRS